MSANETYKANCAKRLKLSLKNRKLSAVNSQQDCDVKRIDLKEGKVEPNVAVYASLANLGNTCFLNSVLHVLRYSPGFRSHLHNLCELIAFLKHNTNEVIPPSWELVSKLHEVFKSLSKIEFCILNTNNEGKDELLSPDKLIVYPQELLSTLRQLNPLFDGNYQHDAHELLCCFLNYIREAEQGLINVLRGQDKKPSTRQQVSSRLKRNIRLSRSKQPSVTTYFTNDKKKASMENGVEHIPDLVTSTFESHTVLHTRCAECENSSRMKEVFLNISVSPHSNEEDSSDEDSADKSDWTLFREAILEAETLSGDNKYWCDFCKRYNEARRSLHFVRLPPILIIQLKRFSSSYNSIPGISKVSDYMPTPHNLGCLLDQCPNPCSDSSHTYRLYAVISHSGISLTSGHYTALVEPGSSKNSHQTHTQLIELLNDFKNELEEAAKNSVRTRQKTKEEENSTCDVKPLSKLQCSTSETSCCSLTSNDCSWLQYDDEKVNKVTVDELDWLLNSPKNTSWTPYLLFYSNDLHNS